MAPAGKVHPPFWIPLWLQVPFFCGVDGRPKPSLRNLSQTFKILLFLMFIMSIICLGISKTLWPSIDRKYCPSILQCKDPCVIQADPDIAGIGIRISTYTQTICNILICGFASSDRKRSSTYGTLVMTSLAMVITMAIFIWQGALSLHHATVASDLLTIMLLPMHFLESWRVNSPGLFIALQPQCNLCSRGSTLGITGHITRPLNRSIKLVVLSVPAFIWLWSHLWTYGPFHLFNSLISLFSEASHNAWTSHTEATQQSLHEWRVSDVQMFKLKSQHYKSQKKNFAMWCISLTWCFSPSSIWLWYDDKESTRSGIKDQKLRKSSPVKRQTTWLGRVYEDVRLAIQVPRCQRMVFSLALAVIFIADCEKTVHLNLTASANEWGYGQIFALVTTLPAISEITRLVLRLGRALNEPLSRAYTL